MAFPSEQKLEEEEFKELFERIDLSSTTETSSDNIYEHFMDSRFNHFYTYDQTLEFLQEMENKYPDIVKLYDIGDSVEGRDIWALKISDNVAVEENEPELLIVSGGLPGYALNKHTVLYNIWQILENYKRQDYYIEEIEYDTTDGKPIPIINDKELEKKCKNIKDLLKKGKKKKKVKKKKKSLDEPIEFGSCLIMDD